MADPDTRTEKDSMGEMKVPAWALWGASTQRAVENFPISGRPIPPEVIHAYGHLKAACAKVNRDLGKLLPGVADAIIEAANEVARGEHDRHFPVDVYQTGSGTSTNMNVNEVIAALATRKLAEAPHVHAGLPRKVHPNDHVNMGQSSNDTFPTAMDIAASVKLERELRPAGVRLQQSLAELAARFDEVVKIGRTHLMDATPIRMGQVFSGYAAATQYTLVNGVRCALDEVRTNLPLGGTAVGTGINTHPEFGRRVCAELSEQLGIIFEEAPNHFQAQAEKFSHVQAHVHLKSAAVSLTKIANDLRLMGSGPRCGFFELMLPAIQPGSSIMPGKVNPVISEAVIQVCCRVIGNDAVITTAGLGGVGSNFELNTAMPVMADAMMESIRLLTGACRVMVDKLLTGLRVNRERCEQMIEQSLMMVTSLAPVLGYDASAKLAKEAFETGKTIRQLVKERGLLDDAKLSELLDPRKMTEPGAEGPGGG